MISSLQLLTDLQSKSTSRGTMVTRLEDDLRERCEAEPEVDAPLRSAYDEARAKKRTALTYRAWRDEQLTQVAVAWVLACVFVRFLEDNGLVEVPKLSGPGERLRRARDEHELFIRRQPLGTERDYLLEVFEETGRLPGMREFFDRRHNPLWLAAPSGDACRELWQFWQRTDPETGALVHDFTDAEWNTRFLGDLYQDLSEAARKKYALLQTPDFVEEFILDRTLTPAIETFGYRELRMIDPTCGSGHFLLGGFQRIFRIWQQEQPQENPRVLAQRTLDAVCGVDLNPFAVAIARFRLLLAALQVCGVQRLADAPDFQIPLAVGDSLIHGARFDSKGQPYLLERQTLFGGGEEVFQDEIAHFFDTEDGKALHRLLGRQYHAVVGNPPYITVKDKALNQLYRDRYEACHRQYALSVPFMERFFDLALAGSGDGRLLAGFTGQITSNSFMKREFGKKLIEAHIPKWDLTHVIDTSGAYIPGHGTPTVILFGRNARPAAATVRTVMGIKGEPATPEDPAQGKVWTAILDQVDHPGSESEFVSAADTEREKFHKHPWSLGGGGASHVKDAISEGAKNVLAGVIDDLGFGALTRLDDAFEVDHFSLRRFRIPESRLKPYVTGDNVRDWQFINVPTVLFPYNDETLVAESDIETQRFLWSNRRLLIDRVAYGKSQIERGLEWFEFSMFFDNRYRVSKTLTFACVSTHNQFVYERERKLFNRHAPVIKLPADATEDDHLRLLALLNSSAACFWMKQVFHCKGSTVDTRGARQTTVPFEDFYEFDGTKLKQFPVVEMPDLALVTAIQKYADALATLSPDRLLDDWSSGGESLRDALASTRALAEQHRRRLIHWQEELDWQVYERYGLIDSREALSLPGEAAMDRLYDRGLILGERAFEIRMARRMKDELGRMKDEAEGGFHTTWFERHKDAGSQPVTELPGDWPADYRALVERRLAAIETHKNLNLIERPEYKRRWNTEPWAKREKEALRKWLLARLEGYFFEGGRVCDLRESASRGVVEYGRDGAVEGEDNTPPLQHSTTPTLQHSNPPAASAAFSPAAHGFTAATRPHLVSANQLADVVHADARFLEAAEVYVGSSGFSVPGLVRELVEGESVPYLPALRYKESGLRKRRDWEETWRLQRREDEVEAEVRSSNPGASEGDVKEKIRKAQQAAVGDIPVPPKYTSADFAKTSYWKLRGKLDVPKERWISYPGAERAGDDSLLIAWAGWDHLQQAQALAEYLIDARDNQGWPADRLRPLLAGLADLVPWLKQWHNDPDPNLGTGLGDYFAGFLEEQCRGLGLTFDNVQEARLNI